MPLRIIPAILVLTIMVPPIAGSSGKYSDITQETFKPAGAIVQTREESFSAFSEEKPIPSESAKASSSPSAPDSQNGSAAESSPPSSEVSPFPPSGNATASPGGQSPQPTPETGNVPQAPGSQSASPAPGMDGGSPAPESDSIEASPDKVQAEEPMVVTDSFPSVDMDTWEYAAFKSDVMAIIKKAEQSSGIKTTYSVFVMDLTTNYTCGVNENLTRVDPYDNMKEGYFNSASVIKLFQGYILCDMMRRGELSAEETYYDSVTGRKFKLLNMIQSMISYSDNNYSNAALRLIGNQKSNEVLDRLGIHDSRIYGEMSGAIGYSRKNNLKRYGTEKRCARITPRDAGLILYNVYINRETDIYMTTIHKGLLGNIYNTRIPVGVARVNRKYEVAHKTGTNSQLGIYNDAGIIYCKRPFILVVFTQSTTSKAGENFIRSLSEQLTRYFDAKA